MVHHGPCMWTWGLSASLTFNKLLSYDIIIIIIIIITE